MITIRATIPTIGTEARKSATRISELGICVVRVVRRGRAISPGSDGASPYPPAFRAVNNDDQSLPRIQLDHELFVDHRSNLFARRDSHHFPLKLVLIRHQ